MTTDLVIGIDSSTTATKAIAWTARGEAVAEGRSPVPLSNPKPGYFEQDAADWWGSTVNALRSVVQKVDPERVAGVAISNQRETFGVFDRTGRALRPGMVWLDERARPQVESFTSAFGAERIHAISGKPRDVTPCLYRFLWLKENEPEIFGATAKIAEVHSYLAYRLTGEWRTSTASADPMGVLDMAAMDWSTEILDAVGLHRDQFASLVRPGTVLGTVSAAAAAETGLKAGTPIVAAGGDGQCAGTGTATLGGGRAYVNLGTAVVSGSYGEPYRHDPAFRTMTAIAEEGYIYEACLRTGTFLVEWMVRTLFGVDPRQEAGVFAALEREAAGVPIGSGGLVTVPYWSGVMTPYWNTSARGVLAGLSASHGRGHVYRSLLEGIALEQSLVSDRIAAASGEPINHYVAIGGGAASNLWCQILADASGRPVLRSATVEASSLGAAVAAARGAGWYGSVAEAAKQMSGEAVAIFEPDPARRARYQDLLAIYADLWPTIERWNDRLVRFADSEPAGI